MTVPSAISKHLYEGNGVTTQWPWTFTLPKSGGLDDTSVIKVYVQTSAGQRLLATSEYDVDATAKKVTYPKAGSTTAVLAEGEKIALMRVVPETQETDLENQGHFKAEVLESEFDSLEMQIQQLREKASRSLTVSETSDNPTEGTITEIFNAKDTAVAAKDAAVTAKNTAIIAAEGTDAQAATVGMEHSAKGWAGEIAEIKTEVLANVAALRLYNGLVGQRIATRGYYTQNDGGQGIYLVREMSGTETDNGGNIIVLANGKVAELAGDVYTPTQFGAKGDGVTNDTAAIKAWAASSCAIKECCKEAQYILRGNIAFNANTKIVKGNGAVFDFTGADLTDTSAFTEAICLKLEGGTPEALPAFSSNISEHSSTITFASAPSVTAGDIIVIYDSAEYSFSKWRAYYKAGEFARVLSVSGTTVTLTNPTYAGYTAGSTVSIYKLNTVTASLKDFTVKGPSNQSTRTAINLRVKYGKDCVLKNVKSYVCGSIGISINKSINISIENCYADSTLSTSTNRYGIAIENSQDTVVTECYLQSIDDGIAHGGDGQVCCVPCRNCKVINNTLVNCDNGGHSCVDMHGNCEYFIISNNYCKGYVNPCGNHAIISNNYIDCYGINTVSCIYFSELVGSDFMIDGNIVVKSNGGNTSRGAFIDFAGDGDVFNTINYGGTLQISNNKFKGNVTNSYAGIVIGGRNVASSETNPMIVVCVNNVLECETSNAILNCIFMRNLIADGIRKVKIHGNIFYKGGVQLSSIKDVNVSFNNIIDAKMSGIAISAPMANNITVSGNTIDKCQKTGISILGSAGQLINNVVVNNNIVKDCNQITTSSSATDAPLSIYYIEKAYVANNLLAIGSCPEQRGLAYYDNITDLYDVANAYYGTGLALIKTNITNKYKLEIPAEA